MPPSLDPKIIGPADELVAKYFPGLPLVPQMLAQPPTMFSWRRSAFRSLLFEPRKHFMERHGAAYLSPRIAAIGMLSLYLHDDFGFVLCA